MTTQPGQPGQPGRLGVRFPQAFLPWTRRPPAGPARGRDERVVLEALETVGEQGLTPVALGVVTALPEAPLDAALYRLLDAGLVVRCEDQRLALGAALVPRYTLAPTVPPQRG